MTPDPSFPACFTCRYFKAGRTVNLCTHPNWSSGGEPLFYAVLKCGKNRDWWLPMDSEKGTPKNADNRAA